MKSAIEAVQKKELSVRKSTITFSVQKDALHRTIDTWININTQLHKKFLLRRRNILTDKQEEELADYINQRIPHFMVSP